MSKTEPMLSVEEVLELQPGDEQNATWVNPGFTAVVRAIKATKTKKGGAMNICTLGSQTGAAEISMTVFSAIKFAEGDLIEVSGQGLRRTVYNQLQQVTPGQKTEIHILGRSAHAPEQAERKAAGQPPVSGNGSFPVNGQTVGMAMKEGLALAGMAAGGVTRDVLKDPLFWQDVKTYAGNIIRISRSLEAGKLSAPSWPTPKREEAPADRSPAPTSQPKTATTKPTEGPGGSAFPADAGDDEDVPF